MNLLITGCNGFIGKALSQKCLELGWSVKGTVRSAAKIHELPQRVEPVIVPDIGVNTDWSKSLNLTTTVVHLAARVHQSQNAGCSSQKPYYHTNTAGTARLAKAAADAGVQRLVFLSTLKVNGEDRSEAFRESDREAPFGAYAVSKYEAENVLREISKRTGLQTVILRPPLVYGPGVKANFLSLLKIVDRGIHLPLASVANRRSLIFVDNMVEAVLICLSHPTAAGKTYLIADKEHMSTPELIKELAFHLGVQSRLIRCPIWMLRFAGRLTRQKEAVAKLTNSLWADTSKINHEIGWTPSCRLSDGLKKTAEWYRSEIHASFRR